MKTALVLGAGGFIGSHMVRRLKQEGYWVRGIDLKYPEFSTSQADEFEIGDLRHYFTCQRNLVLNYQEPFEEVKYFDEVYQFAADMGGAGYVFTGDHDADIMTSAIINHNVCEGLKNTKTKVFYASSACIYPQELQDYEMHSGLKESNAYPGNPDSEYGWEKLFSERLYLAYAKNYGLNIRIGRFHNIYGPEGTYKGGREKAPAALCRKVIESKGQIEIWGDGEQTRSFLYIDDCIDAVRLLMSSDFKEPINIGSEEMVSINDLAGMIGVYALKRFEIDYIKGPIGVRGRNSDNALIKKTLQWEPKYRLADGIAKTYDWIKSQIDG